MRGLQQTFSTREREPAGSGDRHAPRRRPVQAFRRRLALQAAWRRGLRGRVLAAVRDRQPPLGGMLEPLFDQIADTMVDAFTRRAESSGARVEVVYAWRRAWTP